MPNYAPTIHQGFIKSSIISMLDAMYNGLIIRLSMVIAGNEAKPRVKLNFKTATPTPAEATPCRRIGTYPSPIFANIQHLSMSGVWNWYLPVYFFIFVAVMQIAGCCG